MKKVLLKNIKENDVFHFRPKDYGEFANWCRENLFVAMKDDDGKLWLVDTYWGIKRWDNKKYTFTEANKLGRLEYYCNLDDIEKIGKEKLDYYAKEDTYMLHDQHACVESCKYYFVRKGAKRNKQTMLDELDSRIQEAKREIDWNTRKVEEYSAKRQQVEDGNLDIYI